MSKTQPKRSLVIRWDDETQAFKICSVEATKVQDVADQAFNIELPVEAFGGVVTNEIAGRIGVAMVNQLSMTNPDLKALNKTTESGDEPPPDSGEAGEKKSLWKRK
ncbi:hypothetical protein [Paraburkholderia sp. ZP32-5]|uniref:hypothetical protein n=1 Tax=Paraburkholderia sp. ZP32-5 TaxID=2883245 RepID=UPI001F299B25|nr:hypothetical protein [Paraburkholderia sp. ZP32-5]